MERSVHRLGKKGRERNTGREAEAQLRQAGKKRPIKRGKQDPKETTK